MQDSGQPEFYNQASLSKFVPRGVNIVQDTNGPRHRTFDVGFYDNDKMRADLLKLKSYGYNTVRVAINGDGPNGITNRSSTPTSDGFSNAYILNIFQFLAELEAHDMYVIFYTDWLTGAPYGTLMLPGAPDFDDENRFYLFEGGHAAVKLFWQNFARRMLQSNNSRHILAYEIRNELYYNRSSAPFDQIAGAFHRIVTTADGNTYNMRLENDRQTMMDSNMLLFINEVKEGISEIDDEVLVSAGLLVPWQKLANPALVTGANLLDFIDLHIYPHEHFHNFEEYVAAFGVHPQLEVPVIIGEFGAKREPFSRTAFSWQGYTAQGIFPEDYAAAAELVEWQIEMCDYNIQGWINWSLEGADLFYSSFRNESLGDEVAERVSPGFEDGPKFSYAGYFLSPLVRPDPCNLKTAFHPTLWNN